MNCKEKAVSEFKKVVDGAKTPFETMLKTVSKNEEVRTPEDYENFYLVMEGSKEATQTGNETPAIRAISKASYMAREKVSEGNFRILFHNPEEYKRPESEGNADQSSEALKLEFEKLEKENLELKEEKSKLEALSAKATKELAAVKKQANDKIKSLQKQLSDATAKSEPTQSKS